MKTEIGLRSIRKNQNGLTLVELLIAFALVGIITAAVTATTSHLFSGSTRTSNHMTAVRQVQSAGYWLSYDTMQARDVTIDENASGFPVTLRRWDVDDDDVEVVYELQGTDLVRDHNGRRTLVAQHVASIQGERLASDHFRFTITATVGLPGSPLAQSETRVYEVKARPG